MRKFFHEKKLCYIVNFFSILMFGVLFHHCLGITGENSGNLGDEHIYFKTDSILLNIFLICFALFCLYLIGRLSDRLKTERHRNILLGIVCVLSAAMSIYWVFASKCAPQADQIIICIGADAFNRGDFNYLTTGQYIARYPQQLGLVTFLRVIFAMFGNTNYMAFQYLVASLVPLLILSGCQIVRMLSGNNAKAELYYLFFMLTCFPMYAYTAFVYGDLISVEIAFFGVWMYLSCIKRFSWLRLVLFGISMGIAVQLRKNLMILVIALAIVAIIRLLYDRHWKSFAMAAALTLGCGMVYLSVLGIYHSARTEDAPAIPAILFIVMGLNNDNGYPGWHNGYPDSIFDTFNDDLALAKQKGMQDLQMYMNIYRNDPDYMIDFFTQKMNAQWNAPMYQSLAMNNSIIDEQLPPVKNIFQQGKLTETIAVYMKIYQLLQYGGILFLLVCRRNSFLQIEKYLLLIAVFGGLLFSLMWEAKTRYVLPFLFMQIPYMAMGICEITTILEEKFK